MAVTLHVTNAGGRMRPGKAHNNMPSLKAEVWSLKYGVPLEEGKVGWTTRLARSARRFGRRFWKTFGPDKALQGLKEPIPADVLFARPIMTRLK